MSDYLFAIWANRDTCKPYTGLGRVGHVVRVSDAGNMTIINEFATSPSNLSHVACAPSSLQSWFLDKTGVRTSIGEIEALADTTFPNGTSFLGIEAAITHFGGSWSWITPTRGYIMNPGGGYIDSSALWAEYFAARQGGNDALSLTPPNTPPPPPPPPVYNEEEMALRKFVAKNPKTGVAAIFVTNGVQFYREQNPVDDGGVNIVGPWINGDGKPLLMWSSWTPVADVFAFGRPVDKDAADFLGLVFP
jgi:hypothetical protein